MPRVRDLLDRFRPAGAPGAASAVGVPADRRDALAAELEPVFAALQGVIARCAQMRRDAVAECARREEAAAHRARAMLAQARGEAEAERAAAAATLRRRAQIAADEAQRRAAIRAQEIRESGAAARPELVRLAIERARADLAAFAEQETEQR